MNVQRLHQIEMTSRCNLRCRYCTSPTLQRPKVDMDKAMFVQALRWAKHFIDAGTQEELNLAGIGESTIHPEFVRFVNLAREAVGWRCRLVLATNGIYFPEEMAVGITHAMPLIYVSLHRPERAAAAVETLRRHGMFGGVSCDPAVQAIDWAGQVRWPVSVPQNRDCAWLRDGKVMAMADGRVTRCCLDASGVGVLGTLDDDLASMHTSPYALCEKCDQLVPESMRVSEEAA